jgi:hypothetical protein
MNVKVYGQSSSSSNGPPSEKSAWPLAPCGVDALFKEINITKDADDSKMTAKALEVYANPSKDHTHTQLAIKSAELKNHLALLTNIEMSCSLPANEVDTVNELNLSVEKGEVKGGHASEEWDDGFRPRPRQRTHETKDKANGTNQSTTATKLPNANISSLKVSE